MRKFAYILVVLYLTSCSEYQNVLKNDDISAKFRLGTELYESGKFEKANRLFLQIVPKYRGKPQAEKLMYMHSKSYYQTNDFYTSNFKMEQFVESYPKSERVDEIAFLAAKSYYYLSPKYSKDQTETIESLEKLQEFINRYPNSKYFDQANDLAQELDLKLEKKAYEIALQYNTTGPFHRDYNSAITAFNNSLKNFKGTLLCSTSDHTFSQSLGTRIVELTPKGSIDRHMTFDEYMTDPKIKELRSKIYSN